MQVVEEFCDLCRDSIYEKLTEQVKRDNPEWLLKASLDKKQVWMQDMRSEYRNQWVEVASKFVKEHKQKCINFSTDYCTECGGVTLCYKHIMEAAELAR